MTQAFDLEKFNLSDLQTYIDALSNQSSSSDKVKQILRNLLFFVTQTDDAIPELLRKRAVEVLMDLYGRSNDKFVKDKISTILALLGRNVDVVDSLVNISRDSDFDVFIQCLSAIRDRVSLSAVGTGSGGGGVGGGGGGGGGKDIPALRSLSVSSASAILLKMKALLTSSSRDGQKIEALDILIRVVDSFAFNEAVGFSAWMQSSSGGVVKDSPSAKFTSSLSSFVDVLKEIASGKERTALSFLAEKLSSLITQNTFFPTPISLMTKVPTTVSLPIRFLLDRSNQTNVTISGGKCVWNSGQYYWLILDEEITSGIYKVTVDVVLSGTGNSLYMFFGLIDKSLVHNHKLSDYFDRKPGTCHINYNNLYLGSGLSAYNGNLFPSSGKTTLALEVNADTHVVYFLVNGNQIPHCIANVPKSVYCAASNYHTTETIEVTSFQKLSAPTIDGLLRCTSYQWM